MSLPNPTPGLVLRYGYLWADDAQAGIETRKDRPAVVVLALTTDHETRLLVVPITHSRPDDETLAIEMPDSVRRSAGLDSSRSWVVLSEVNEFT